MEVLYGDAGDLKCSSSPGPSRALTPERARGNLESYHLSLFILRGGGGYVHGPQKECQKSARRILRSESSARRPESYMSTVVEGSSAFHLQIRPSMLFPAEFVNFGVPASPSSARFFSDHRGI